MKKIWVLYRTDGRVRHEAGYLYRPLRYVELVSVTSSKEDADYWCSVDCEALDPKGLVHGAELVPVEE